MLIGDICNETGLTKKAIGYYEERGLVNPKVDDNGYRIFSPDDLERLKNVKLYRELGIGVEDIKVILNSKFPKEELKSLLTKRIQIMDFESERQNILSALSKDGNVDEALKSVESLNKKLNIKTKLLDAFPGYFGRLVLSNFAPFLNGKIETDEQMKAYEIVIDYLDNLEMDSIPEEIHSELEEAISFWDDDRLADVQKSKIVAIEDIEKFMGENAESINMMEEYKESEEYKNSALPKLQESLSKVFSSEEYTNIFIPAMRRLSVDYNEYYEKMLAANDKMKNILNNNK